MTSTTPPAHKQVAVTLTGSVIASRNREKTQAVLRGLGLRRRHHTVVVPNTPEVQGMLRVVAHLVDVQPAS